MTTASATSDTVTLTTREHLRWIQQFWRGQLPFAVMLLLWTLLSSGVAVSFPLVWKVVLDRLESLPPGATLPASDLTRFAALLAIIAIARIVAGFYPALRMWMNLKIEKAVRGLVFASILTKDHTFFSRFRTGDLTTRLTDDITEYPRIAWFSCSGIFRFIDSASRVTFCFAVAVSRTNDTLEAALSGIRVVKAFNSEAGQERRLAGILQERIRIQLRLARLVALVHQSDNLASRIGQVLVLSIGGLRVIDGDLTLGTLLALHLYLDMLVQPMMDLPNLNEWHWPALRARIGYVPQESLLFSETIADNVSFGREVDGTGVAASLDAAQMSGDLARIELGSAAVLGRGGTRVSGGQRQRIAIARALAGRPDVLLLDDSTSSLDARTEDRLWDAIRQTCPGVTIFCVSHRPTTIRRADLILVLERGRLVDAGTHGELSARCRVYGDFLLAEERREHLEGSA